MGPLRVLVFPCFRKTIIVTCNILSFLCSEDHFLLKNVIVFFFSKSKVGQNGAHLKKKAIFDILSDFLVTSERTQKILQHISHLHTYTYFAHAVDFFALTILQKLQIYHVWFLFGATPGIDSYSIV